MSHIFVLDTGPAGKLAHPKADLALSEWLLSHLRAGDVIVLPEIVDYELRRNFLLEIARGKSSFQKSLDRLDSLREVLTYLPINSDVMRRAAQLWADARRQGKPTADPKELDGDVILAAQALSVNGVIITENIGHLTLFVEAKTWREA
jgi:predicted nucleic acid-binding protein